MSDATRRAPVWPLIAVLLLGAALPLLLSGGFQLRVATLVWIYATLAMGFNLLFGFTGQISMGQQAFFAVGAYAFALLQARAGWGPLPAFGAAIAVCAALGLVVGAPLLRLRSHYLAMATLALGLILNGVANRWIGFTGGTSGITVPPLTWGGEPVGRVGLYYVILVIAGLVLLLHDLIARSHVGRALQAVRDDETAAAALGVPATRWKLRIFVLAAAISGVAGCAFALLSQRVDPSLSEFHVLVSLLTIAVVGGLGTRFGPVVGAALITVLPQILLSFGAFETLVYGLFIVLFLLFVPHGLAGLIETRRWRRAGPAAARRPAAAPRGRTRTREGQA